MAFPTTSVLDDFNRADEGPPPSASWSSADISTAGGSKLSVVSNAMRSNTDSLTGNQGGLWGTQFGPDCEVYTTVASLPSDSFRIMLWLRAVDIGGAGTEDCYQSRFRRVDGNPGYTQFFFRWDNNVATQLGTTFSDSAGALAGGVKFGLDMVGSTLSAYVNRSGTWSSAVATASDTTYTAAGYIGVAAQEATGPTGAVFDDFGGGSIGGAPPPATTVKIIVMQGNRW